MLPLYRARDLPDAQLLVGRLSSQGIRTYVRNEALQGALGELPLTLQPEVCVLSRADWDAAVVILQDFESSARQPIIETDQLCAECGEQSPGNFELCWRCRAPFPEH